MPLLAICLAPLRPLSSPSSSCPPPSWPPPPPPPRGEETRGTGGRVGWRQTQSPWESTCLSSSATCACGYFEVAVGRGTDLGGGEGGREGGVQKVAFASASYPPPPPGARENPRACVKSGRGLSKRVARRREEEGAFSPPRPMKPPPPPPPPPPRMHPCTGDARGRHAFQSSKVTDELRRP